MSTFNSLPTHRTHLNQKKCKLPTFLSSRIERYYKERVEDAWKGGHIMHGLTADKNALHLSSNDYLSIAQQPEILNAMANSILKNGNGLVMSGVFLHGKNPQMDLENKLAAFMHAEAGVLCQSGWCANTGLIQSIASVDTPVYIDMLAHTSLSEGIRSANAKPILFWHNDPDHLKKLILRYGAGIILVDSVYSTTGSVCPLTEIVEIANTFGCVLVVDESHSLGTHGLHGEGLVAALGLTEQVHFRTASLAKAFAGRAGFIACSRRFSEYFRYESNPAIFSSTLLPHDIAGLDATLSVIKKDDWRRERLHANTTWLSMNLEKLGYNLNNSESQIISLEAGTEQNTMLLRDALQSRGIFGSVFCAPATPKNRSLIRFSVNTDLTQEDLTRLVNVCRDIREEVNMENWPSTRRMKRSGTNVSQVFEQPTALALAA
jgi:CAI-1 autoinducer synthase